MRRILLTIVTLGACAINALAQGQFSFAANTINGDGLISYSLDGVTSTPYPLSPGLATYGNVNIGFFVAPIGTPQLVLSGGLPNFTSSWTPATTVLNLNGGPVSSAGNTFTVSTLLPVANNPVQLEVVAWTGTSSTWSSAVNAGNDLLGFSGEVFNGTTLGSLSWSQATSSGAPVNLVTGPGGFAGIVLARQVGAPEPSTLALGGLGAGVLVLIRRLRNRKTTR